MIEDHISYQAADAKLAQQMANRDFTPSERAADDAAWLADQEMERAASARMSALHLAIQTHVGSTHTTSIINTAREYLAFLQEQPVRQ